MGETRKIAAILAADVVGYSRLTSVDEDRTLARLRALRSDLIDPTIAVHHGRVVKRTGDGALVEFRSVVDAVRCAIEVQNSMLERNAGLPPERRIEFRIGIHLGDVVEESDGDLMGDGVNIAARLEGIAKPGAVCLSEDAYRQVKSRLDLAVTDFGVTSLKNIAEPIRVYSLQVGVAAEARPLSQSKTRGQTSAAEALEKPDKPSIAVLPFQNMSGDAEQEYFADGIVEDIITALSRFKSLFVIARNSSFTYKGRSVDIKQIGHELGVRYVLEGSVRKAGNRLRITGQLIEAASNNHLWADKFDGDLADVFDLQDRITASVVGIIAPRIQQSEFERARAKPTDRLDSYDCYLRGQAASLDRSKWATSEIRDWFKRACESDSNYAAAHAGLASSGVLKQTAIGQPLAADERTEVIEAAERAYKLGNDDSSVVARAAHAFGYVGREFNRAEAMIEEALSLNPNDAGVWIYRGYISLMCSQTERALESFKRLLQLSPRDSRRGSVWNGMGFAYFRLGRYEEGYALAARAAEVNIDVHTLSALIVNEVGIGRMEDARKHAVQLSQLWPDFRASHAIQIFPSSRSPSTSDGIVTALCLAGVPE